MKLILNVLWFVFGGWISLLAWLLAGLVLACTIVGLPWAFAAFRIALSRVASAPCSSPSPERTRAAVSAAHAPSCARQCAFWHAAPQYCTRKQAPHFTPSAPPSTAPPHCMQGEPGSSTKGPGGAAAGASAAAAAAAPAAACAALQGPL
jgi:hypothetical protein